MKQVQEPQKQEQSQVNGKCLWCLENSPLTNATRKCCALRRLALAPRHAQASYAATLPTDEKNALRPVLVAEIKRLRELK